MNVAAIAKIEEAEAFITVYAGIVENSGNRLMEKNFNFTTRILIKNLRDSLSAIRSVL